MTEIRLTMFRLVNLVQVEGLAEVLDQIVSDDRPGVVLQRFEVPHQLERLVLRENLLRVLLLAVLQPFVLPSAPCAVVPDFTHEAAGLLVHALLLVPLHQFQRQTDQTTVAEVLARELELARQPLECLRANVAQVAVADGTSFVRNAAQAADRVSAHAEINRRLQQAGAAGASQVAEKLRV